MGNSQSAEVPKRQSQKLSKPRTGSHAPPTATAGLLSPSGFSNTFSSSTTSRRFSNARWSTLPPPPSPASSSASSSPTEAMREVEQPVERRPSVVSEDEDEPKRRSLFRSKSSQGPSKSERRNSLLGARSRGPDKVARANSMTYESAISYYGAPTPEISWQGPPKSRTSWNYDLSSYEAKRLLNLVEEPVLEHGPALSEQDMSVITETTWKSSNPANPASTPITRANSDVSLYMPVRRRSVIQKPGVATRANSARDGFAQTRPNFRYSHPPTPNLSRQQSFESYRSGVMSMPPRIADPDSLPRVVTPCEEEYQSIGAFKLGSLRITNGAASPVSPEVEKHDKEEAEQGHTNGRGDYFTRMQSQQPGMAASNALQIMMQTSEPVEVNAPQLVSPQQTTVVALSHKIEVADIVPGTVDKDVAVAVTDIPQYLEEISFSPFSLLDSEPPSPKLQTTSKTTALEDQLFDDELQAEYSSAEVLDVRLDPSAKSPHGQTNTSEKTRNFERTDSGFVSITGPVPGILYKPLTKADSGYSSNVSLRSFQLKNLVPEEELGVSLEKQLSQSSQRSGTAPVEEQRLMKSISVPLPPRREAPPPPISPPQREAPPPPVPPKDFPSSPTIPSISLSVNNTPSNVGFFSTPTAFRSKKTPAPIKNLPSALTAPKSPESLPLTPASARSAKSDNSASTLSIGSGSQKPSKLQRLLSSARRPGNGPLTVHTTHVVEKTGIPSIPQHVEHKLHEHTGMFPITTKRLALKPRSSMDTLKTIFSVGSMEASLDAVNSISAGPRVTGGTDVISESKEPVWRQTLQSMPSHIAHVAAHMVPRKPIARKPVPSRQGSLNGSGGVQKVGEATHVESTVPVEEANLTVYNSVNISLGKNAYDAALIADSTAQHGYLSPAKAGRTMSLTLSVEQKFDMKLVQSGSSVPDLAANLPSPALPSPLLARSLESKTRTPPPVSMMNRRPGSLRVPPPLRSQSSTASLSRRSSRESLHSYASTQSLARKMSRENIHSYPSYQHATSGETGDGIPPVPTMDPRRINAFRRSQTLYSSQSKTPNWDVQTDHDILRLSARTPLSAVGNDNWFSSNQTQNGYGLQRSASAQGWKVQTGHPPLRHRSSYDGYNRHQKQQYGHPPSMSNGYTAPPKPVDQGIPQFDLVTSLSMQDGRYPPYVPRSQGHSHRRNRSMSGHGNNAPYRILHSYNSPAYRNAPIWG